MMRSARFRSRVAVGAGALLLAAAAPAMASTMYGALSNFDVFNDTGGDCHGFEIELEDVTSRDVGYTFGAPYERYGDPKIVDFTLPNGHPGVYVRYESPWDPATQTFTATTPLAPTPIAPTDGHSCYNGSGIGNYDTSGCEHFGLGLAVNPTNTTYRWLVADPAVPGALQPLGTTVSIPAVTFNVQPPPVVGQPPVVQAVIPVPQAPEAGFEFGEAQWVKVYKTESPNDAELEHLLTDDPAVPDGSDPVEVETEWFLLQASINNPANNEFAAEAQVGAGNESVTRRYEFYRYIGAYDAETHEALCDNPDSLSANCQIPGGVVGDYMGAQMAALNLDPSFAINSLLPNDQMAGLSTGTVGEVYPERPLVLGGTEPYLVEQTGGTIPAGLSLDPTSGILSGTPTEAGSATFSILAVDAAGAVVTGTFAVTIDAADGAVDACPDDPAKIAPGVCGCGVPDTDSDGDGTPDCIDGCPLDAAKTGAGVCGCGVADTDSDGDGTADCLDGCAADPSKTAPGICGCGVADTDSDGDGTADCLDGCPSDPSKINAGICGCGIADTDSDGDGTANCLDGCAADPSKIAPGICGCGVADTDSDGDGTPDCLDGCAADPSKIAPGVCGCGVADVDTNGNGIIDCVEPRTDLASAITGPGATIKVRKKTQYSLVASNLGPIGASNVVIRATLSGVPYSGLSLPKGCTLSAGTISCALGNISAGRSASKAIALTPTATGKLTVTAVVSSSTLDSNLANQSVTVTTTVTP